MSQFSDFMRHASDEERKKVVLEAAQKATEEQIKTIAQHVVDKQADTLRALSEYDKQVE